MKKRWLEHDDKFLCEHYCNSPKEFLIKKLNVGWGSIQNRASKLKLVRNNFTNNGNFHKIWSDEDISFLRLHYADGDKTLIVKKLNRTWSSIQNKTFQLGIERDILNANISKLINGTNESYYWLGFIMADGHFSKANRICINLCKKDLAHLKKFANFVEYTGDLIKPSITISYNKIKDELYDKFRISNNKTYEPCLLDKLSGEAFFSFIIGFMDGDGTINKKGNLYVVSHKNWFDNIDSMLRFLTNKYFCSINKSGLVVGGISNIETMKSIKTKILKLELPILNRKWDRVNFNKLSKSEKHELYKDECITLFNTGLSPVDIINQTKISRSFVYKILKESIKEKDLKRELDRTT